MAKKKVYNLFNKIRAALRDVQRYSPMRKEVINKVKIKDPELGGWGFTCPVCKHDWPIAMADVDHEPPLGPFEEPWNNERVGDWIYRLFYGPVQVLCKLCHKKKTASQRKKKR